MGSFRNKKAASSSALAPPPAEFYCGENPIEDGVTVILADDLDSELVNPHSLFVFVYRRLLGNRFNNIKSRSFSDV